MTVRPRFFAALRMTETQILRCAQNDRLFIQNNKLCAQNDRLFIQNNKLCAQNDSEIVSLSS